MQVTQAFREQVCDLARREGAISAVKQIRQATGVSLASAVKVLEQWMQEGGSRAAPSGARTTGFTPRPPPVSNRTIDLPSGSLTRPAAGVQGRGITFTSSKCPPGGDFTKVAGGIGAQYLTSTRGGSARPVPVVLGTQYLTSTRGASSGPVAPGLGSQYLTATKKTGSFIRLALKLAVFLLFAMGILNEIENLMFRADAETVQGIVVSIDPQGTGSVPVIAVENQGWPLTVRGQFPFADSGYSVGAPVRVALGDGGELRVLDGPERWLVPGILFGGAILCLVILGFTAKPE